MKKKTAIILGSIVAAILIICGISYGAFQISTKEYGGVRVSNADYAAYTQTSKTEVSIYKYLLDGNDYRDQALKDLKKLKTVAPKATNPKSDKKELTTTINDLEKQIKKGNTSIVDVAEFRIEMTSLTSVIAPGKSDSPSKKHTKIVEEIEKHTSNYSARLTKQTNQATDYVLNSIK